jgi:hypothetical protein
VQKLMIIRHDAQFRCVGGRLFPLRVLGDQGRRGDAFGTSREVQWAAWMSDMARAALGISRTSLAAMATRLWRIPHSVLRLWARSGSFSFCALL